MPFLRCSTRCCLAVGVDVPADSPETFVFGVVADCWCVGALCPLIAPGSLVAPCSCPAPCCFIAPVSWVAPCCCCVVPGCVAGGACGFGCAWFACAFSGACLFVDGDWCSTGCWAKAAPASPSEQPISKLVIFFIIMVGRGTFAIYSGSSWILLSRALVYPPWRANPNAASIAYHSSCDRTYPVPSQRELQLDKPRCSALIRDFPFNLSSWHPSAR